MIQARDNNMKQDSHFCPPAALSIILDFFECKQLPLSPPLANEIDEFAICPVLE